jgi:hypothetical protein
MQTENKIKAQFNAVASISSELRAVVVISKEISLAAANAKAIAFRAGDKAKGFQPITDFINDLAKETIDRVDAINVLARILCQVTVNGYRKAKALNKFEQVTKIADTAVYANTIQGPLAEANIVAQEHQRQFNKEVNLLLNQLETVMQQAQTARIIATYSRIEASQSGEYLQSLQAVAQNVDKAAHSIQDNVQRCLMALSIFRNS